MVDLSIRVQNRYTNRLLFQSPKKYRKNPDVLETEIIGEQ